MNFAPKFWSLCMREWVYIWLLGAAALLQMLLQGALIPAFAAETYFDKGVALYNKQKYMDALRCFDYFLTKEPQNANAHYYRAVALHHLGYIYDAKKEYQNVVAKFPKTQAAELSERILGDSVPPKVSMAHSYRPTPDHIPDDQTVSFRKSKQGDLLVSAHIDGRPTDMIFDTGADVCLMSKDHLRALGLPMPTGKPTTTISGVGAKIPAWEVEHTISIGKLSRRQVICVAEKLECEPLLGQTFFGDLQYSIDNATGHIRFMRKGAGQRNVPIYTANVPYRKLGNNIVVTVRVNGIETDAYFDTGAAVCSFSYLDAIKLELRPTENSEVYVGTREGISAANKSVTFEVDSMELGPIRRRNVAVSVTSGYQGLPLLGQSFFGFNRFVIDPDAQVIRFFQ